MKLCLFRGSIIKRGYQNEKVSFTVNGQVQEVTMLQLEQIISTKSNTAIKVITKTVKEMELLNQDPLDFLAIVAKNHFINQEGN